LPVSVRQHRRRTHRRSSGPTAGTWLGPNLPAGDTCRRRIHPVPDLPESRPNWGFQTEQGPLLREAQRRLHSSRQVSPSPSWSPEPTLEFEFQNTLQPEILPTWTDPMLCVAHTAATAGNPPNRAAPAPLLLAFEPDSMRQSTPPQSSWPPGQHSLWLTRMSSCHGPRSCPQLPKICRLRQRQMRSSWHTLLRLIWSATSR
jgi:hypothetical protein